MKKEVIVHKDPKSPISEMFRTLRTNIQFMNINNKMKTLLITSTFPDEGKSWTVANLAVTFAQAGKKVILIDSDMRKGRQYAIFGTSPTPGLSNFLSQVEMDENGKVSENVSNYIQETEIENLYIMPAGNVPPNPSDLLVSAQMTKLLEQLRELCDIVIIDGTPSELITDSVILSRLVDATVIVTDYKKTKKDVLERVVKNIQNVGGKIVGVVLNKQPASGKLYGEKYYYYGQNNETKNIWKWPKINKKNSKAIEELNKKRIAEAMELDKKQQEERNATVEKLEQKKEDQVIDKQKEENTPNNTEKQQNTVEQKRETWYNIKHLN